MKRALEVAGANVSLTNDPNKILTGSHVVLPGVGAYSSAMKLLKELGYIEALNTLVRNNVPLLGICLGMQLFFDESEEFNVCKGLGYISGKVISLQRINSQFVEKIPHNGWAELKENDIGISWNKSIFKDIKANDSVYFTHSYVGDTAQKKDILAYCKFGNSFITAAVQKQNIIGCQFHPEKSGEVGLKILERFISL